MICPPQRFRSCHSSAWKSARCRLTSAAFRLQVNLDSKSGSRPTTNGRSTICWSVPAENMTCSCFGGRALNCMRVEKSFGTWAREYRPIYGPIEAGLGRFVDFKKDKFIGRAAAMEEKGGGGALRLMSFKLETADADALGDEPIWHEDKVVGWVTSGAFGHRVNHSLALGYVPAPLASATSGFEIEIIGERHHAEPLSEAAYDAKGSRMRT